MLAVPLLSLPSRTQGGPRIALSDRAPELVGPRAGHARFDFRLDPFLMRSRRVVLLALLLVPALVTAHPQPRVADRELVRLQGRLRADGDAPAGRITLTALGTDHPFAALAREVYALTSEQTATLATRFTLQGPRPVLARFAGARADQTVTILAERRPGSDTLFVLALDLCPPQ